MSATTEQQERLRHLLTITRVFAMLDRQSFERGGDRRAGSGEVLTQGKNHALLETVGMIQKRPDHAGGGFAVTTAHIGRQPVGNRLQLIAKRKLGRVHLP